MTKNDADNLSRPMKEISDLTVVFIFYKGKLNMKRRKNKKGKEISFHSREAPACGNAFSVFLVFFFFLLVETITRC